MSEHDSVSYRRSSERTPRRRAKPATSPLLPLWIVAGCAAFVLLLVFADVVSSAGRVHPRVSVGGVKLGGMTPREATESLRYWLPRNAQSSVVVKYQDKSWTVAPIDLAITFDYDALTESAMGVGRGSGPVGDARERVSAWLASAPLPARATAEQDRLDTLIGEIAGEVDLVAQDAEVVFKSTTASVTSAASGMVVNRQALAEGLLTAFTSPQRVVEAPVVRQLPQITDAAAESARTQAEAMVATPVTVKWESKTWKLSRKTLAKMIDFKKVPGSGAGEWALDPTVGAEETSKTLTPVFGGAIGSPARDAGFRTRNGSVSIVPAKTGVGPDMEALAAELTAAMRAAAGQPRTVLLRTRKTSPAITTPMARAMHVKERISTYTTYYSAGNRPRVNNIHLLGDSLDGKLVAPGATFSFNGAVGERTAAKGYKEANAIVDGKLVPQLGGGICQVGTTLFNAVFISGFSVVERHNHSFYISHYPKGRDATVSWGGPDLKFKNDSEDWVLISVSYTSGSITMSLYGTDPGYKVTSVTTPFTNERPFPTEKTKDPKLEVGVKVIEDPGVTGRTCTVTRTVKKGGEVVREDTFKSVYRPKIEIVRVGTKPQSSKPTTHGAGSTD